MKRKRLKTFIVYMAVNQVTGRRYIGATSMGLAIRRRDHVCAALKGSVSSKKFYNAIRKYGPGSFSWLILATVASAKEMFAAEIRLIAQLKPELNLTRGGEGIVGWKRTKSWRTAVSKATKGRPLKPENVEASRKARRERFFKRVLCKTIVCLNDGKFFTNIQDAASFYGISESGIVSILKGKRYFHKGYAFSLAAAPLPNDQRLSLLAAIKDKVKAGHLKIAAWKRRVILCVDDGKQYSQTSVAAAAYNLSENDVRRRCLDKKSTKTSLTFRFLN